MATSSAEYTSTLTRKRKLFEITQRCMDKFQQSLEERVSLEEDDNRFPRFYKENEIFLASEIAKAEVISEFQDILAREMPEDAHILATRLESLEAMLETVVTRHVQENNQNRVFAENYVTDEISTIMERFTSDLEEYGAQTAKLEMVHAALKPRMMSLWEYVRKPDNAEFEKTFEERLQNLMKERCSELIRKRLVIHEDLREPAKVEILKQTQKLQAKLMKKKDTFDVTMNAEWKQFTEELAQKTLNEFRKSTLIQTPKPHTFNETMEKMCVLQMEETRAAVDSQRWNALYPEAVRRCVTIYLFSMDSRLVGMNYVSRAELNAFHETDQKEALDMWELMQMEGEKAADFKMELENKISKALALYQAQVDASNKAMDREAVLFVEKCADKYKLEMQKEVKTLHQKCGDRIRKMLRERYTGQDQSGEFILKHEKELNGFLMCMAYQHEKLYHVVDVPQLPANESKKRSLEPFVPHPFVRSAETERFENLYYEQIRMHLHDDDSPEETIEVFSHKLEKRLLSAFKKYCILEEKSEVQLSVLLENLKRAMSYARHREEIIDRVIKRLKREYDEKCTKNVWKYPRGVEHQTSQNLHNTAQQEILKLLEMEIRRTIGVEEPLHRYKQIMQRYFDTNLEISGSTTTTGKGDTQKSLPPLAFHLQSRHVSMAVAVSNYVRILKNELGEEKTPAVVVGTPEGTLVYGTPALSITETTPNSLPGFTWSLANFFLSNDFLWSKTVTVNGTAHHFTSEFMLAYLLKKMKIEAERQMKGICTTAVLAVPFWLSSAQRVKVKDAGKLAGFSTVHLMNESSAAAYNLAVSKMNANIDNREVMVFCENLDRVDAFVYSYSWAHCDLKMLSHFGNYRMEDGKKNLPEMLKTLLKQFEGCSPSGLGDIRSACKIAEQLANKEVGRVVKPVMNLCISDNPAKWASILNTVSAEFGAKSYGMKEKEAVLYGAAKLGKEPHKIGCTVKDKMAWDVSCYLSTNQSTGQLDMSKVHTLAIESKQRSIPLKQGQDLATFFQVVVDKEHILGDVVIKGVQSGQTLKPIFDITNEAIVSLSKVEMQSTAAGDEAVECVAEQNIQWHISHLYELELHSLSGILARLMNSEQ